MAGVAAGLQQQLVRLLALGGVALAVLAQVAGLDVVEQVGLAAAALVANPNAWRSFTRGATGRGGPLGARRRGDLQTQIDALQPFLTSAGLTYEQFKSVVAESGVKLFDEFGRMVPDSLQRFAGG